MKRFEAYVDSNIPTYITMGGSIPVLLMNLFPNSLLKISIMLFFLIIQVSHLAMMIYKVLHD